MNNLSLKPGTNQNISILSKLATLFFFLLFLAGCAAGQREIEGAEGKNDNNKPYAPSRNHIPGNR
jgi:hypothetical protein